MAKRRDQPPQRHRPVDDAARSAPRVPEDVTAVLERISDAVVALDRRWVYTHVRWFENRICPWPDDRTICFQNVTDRKREEARPHEVLQEQAATSAPGRGCTFDVYIPAVSRDLAAASGDPATGPPQPGRETILIVDDEESLVGVARRMLESVGYVTLTATGARAALRIAAQTRRPIHLLVTDVVMPEMSGTQLAGRLTALHPETRVLFTSGYTDDSLLRDAVHHRSAALLSKPYAATGLRRSDFVLVSP